MQDWRYVSEISSEGQKIYAGLELILVGLEIRDVGLEIGDGGIRDLGLADRRWLNTR